MNRNVDAKLLDVIAKSWTDEKFKEQLMADPAAMLAREGIEVPAGATVRVVEQAPNEVFLFLPPRPEGNIDIQNVSSQAAASAKLCQPPPNAFENVAISSGTAPTPGMCHHPTPSPLPNLTLFCLGHPSPPPRTGHFAAGQAGSPLPTLTHFCIGPDYSPIPALTHLCYAPAPMLTFFCLPPISMMPAPALTWFCLAPISPVPAPTLTWFCLAHTKPAHSEPGEGS